MRLDRYWPDLEAAVTEVHPDAEVAGELLTRLVRSAVAAYAERPADLHQLDQRRLFDAGLAPAAAACSATPATPTGSPGISRASPAPGPPRGARRHLPAPDAAAGAGEGDNDGGYAVADYGAVRPRPRHHGRPGAARATLRGQGISPASIWCSTTSRGSMSGPERARAGDPCPATATTSTSSPTATCRRIRADPARGVPGLRARQLHLGRRARGLGLDDVQRVAVGPRLGQPRRVRPSSPRHPVAGQPRGRGAPAGRHPRSSGSGWAPTARTSPRCTRSPRRCTR